MTNQVNEIKSIDTLEMVLCLRGGKKKSSKKASKKGSKKSSKTSKKGSKKGSAMM